MTKKIFRRLAAATMVTALSFGAALLPASGAHAEDSGWPIAPAHGKPHK